MSTADSMTDFHPCSDCGGPEFCDYGSTCGAKPWELPSIRWAVVLGVVFAVIAVIAGVAGVALW